ncbi:MAG TPA: hypothetical protein VGC79_15130 [Polyangiaceae bacterium]
MRRHRAESQTDVFAAGRCSRVAGSLALFLGGMLTPPVLDENAALELAKWILTAGAAPGK